MKRTTLLIAALAVAVIGTATPAFAMRDPGVGGMAMYNYGPTPPRVGQTGLNNQYADGMNLYQYVRSAPTHLVDPYGLGAGWWVAPMKQLDQQDAHFPRTAENAYRVGLWENTGANKGTCVLYMELKLNWHFKNMGGTGLSNNQKWDFMKKVVREIKAVWNNGPTIALDQGDRSCCKCPNGTRVEFEIENHLEQSWSNDAWNVWVDVRAGGPGIDAATYTGSVTYNTKTVLLDTEDPVPHHYSSAPAGVTQRGYIHEFGHMLGLRDEYAGPGGDTPWWTGDTRSVMNLGEVVRGRHFGPLAQWVTDEVRAATGRKDCWYEVSNQWWTGNSGL
jgi:hypothetical protein